MNANLTVLHRHLCNLGHVGRKGVVHCHAEVMSLGNGHPSHSLTSDANHILTAWVALGVLQSKGHLVNTRRLSDLVNHGLLSKRRIGVPYRPPKSERQAVFYGHMCHTGVGLVVVFKQALGTRFVSGEIFKEHLTGTGHPFHEKVS